VVALETNILANQGFGWKERSLSANVKSNVYILSVTFSVHVYTYVVLLNFYFTVYQRRCYIVALYVTFVRHALPEDGHKYDQNM
jgi:hypothetical protein